MQGNLSLPARSIFSTWFSDGIHGFLRVAVNYSRTAEDDMG